MSIVTIDIKYKAYGDVVFGDSELGLGRTYNIGMDSTAYDLYDVVWAYIDSCQSYQSWLCDELCGRCGHCEYCADCEFIKSINDVQITNPHVDPDCLHLTVVCR